jgi:chromosome segregation ATPase
MFLYNTKKVEKMAKPSSKIDELTKNLEQLQSVFSELQSKLAASEASQTEFGSDVAKHVEAITAKYQLETALKSAITDVQGKLFSVRDALDLAIDEYEKSEAKARLQTHQSKLAELSQAFNEKQSALAKTLMELYAASNAYSNDHIIVYGSDKTVLSSAPDPRALLFAQADGSVVYFNSLSHSATPAKFRAILEGASV